VLTYFDVAIGWPELLKRTWREFQDDDALGLAAQLAYYFFLALFPALLFLIALASFFPLGDLAANATQSLQRVAAPGIVDIIRGQLTQLSGSADGGVLSFGVLAALWSSSAAMVAIIDALNRAYDVEDGRPWWKRRLTAVAITLAVAIFLLASLTLVLVGPELGGTLASRLGLGAAFEWGWKILQWPLVFALVATAISLIYYYAPDVDQDFVWLTPGSLAATALWLIGSLAFRVYIVNFGSYNQTYGAIGGVMVLMLWLYLSGVSVLAGAELNAEIEHASPHGKAPGEKVPGQRKTIGARAARAWKERMERGPRPQPVAAPEGSLRPRAAARGTVLLGGAIAALFGRRMKD
jgi:membrane protein